MANKEQINTNPIIILKPSFWTTPHLFTSHLINLLFKLIF